MSTRMSLSVNIRNSLIPSLLLLMLLPTGSFAACQYQTWEQVTYAVCSFTPSKADIRLFQQTPLGQNLGSFRAVNDLLAKRQQQLAFAMNAGMYHADRRPVGLYIEDGRQQSPVVIGPSRGNFGMLPNGVLCLSKDKALIMETRRYRIKQPACRYATQSGPMLVINGRLHPRFLPQSDSYKIRNGVGIDKKGQVHFVISEQAVSFYQFARFFREYLHTPNALYLDGSISKLYAPELGRADHGQAMGPMVGVVVPNHDN